MFNKLLKDNLIGKTVGLSEMLTSREERKKRQDTLRRKWNQAIISFTMNVPGKVKVYPLIEECYLEGMKKIQNLLETEEQIIDFVSHTSQTGLEALWVVKGDALLMKQRMIALEEVHPLGRYWDIDVINSNGEALSRNKPRKCFLCSELAFVCSRSKAHQVEELLEKQIADIIEWKQSKYVKSVGNQLVKALLYELATSPKPGLVDRFDVGPHPDMSFYLFIDSAIELREYFEDLVTLGMKSAQEDDISLEDTAKVQGILAESHMFEVTQGKNTHKGAIFLLGVLALTAGRCFDLERNLENLLGSVSSNVKSMIFSELESMDNSYYKTAGEKQYINLGIKGPRGEVGDGFPILRRGYYHFINSIERGNTFEESGVHTLLFYIATIDDTTTIKRCGREQQLVLKKYVDQALTENRVDRVWIEKLNLIMTRKNASAGGAADLLAATYFLYFYLHEFEIQ